MISRIQVAPDRPDIGPTRPHRDMFQGQTATRCSSADSAVACCADRGPEPGMVTEKTVADLVGTTNASASTPPPTGRVITRIDVKLFGSFAVRVDDRAISSKHWSRRHAAALVKLLAMAPHRSLHREQVIDALWPDVSIEDAAPRLHKAAHYARKALDHPDAVVLSARAVRLFPYDDVRVDMVEFRYLAESAVTNGGVAAARTALAAHGGALLPQDIYEAWAEPHRHHLSGLYLELLHQAEYWHHAVSADPTHEPAHLALVKRYTERGDRAAALRQLDQLERVLRQEAGVEPSELALDLRRQLVDAGR